MIGQCDESLLEAALAGTLSADAESTLSEHLDECESCASQLERLAGEPALRAAVAELLPTDQWDADAPSGDPDDWSDVDFTVEHLEPASTAGVLGRLGSYDVLEVIGRGGMGVVLKGYDPELKRCVAIKVLAPHLARSSVARKRFAREAQAAAAVVHHNVLAIHQVQASGALPYLVMPLVAGESLAQRLATRGPLELTETLRIGMQAAAGLAAAHEQGLVHRDVKPANILLERGVERAVLTDFGLARAADDATLTRWGAVAGTPQYMSPEQAEGKPLDARSDLFSLGIVLYEMTTGVSPFRAETTIATIRRLVEDAPPAIATLNPETPPWLVALVERLLEKNPADRYSSAREVSELLEACLAHIQQPAVVPLPGELRTSSAGGRRRLPPLKWLAAGALGFLFVLAGILIVLDWKQGKLTIATDSAAEALVEQERQLTDAVSVSDATGPQGQMSYGPPIVRTVPPFSGGVKCALVLESGELIVPPDDLGAINSWAEREGIDVVGTGHNGVGGFDEIELLGRGTIAAPAADWNASPDVVAAVVRKWEDDRKAAKNPTVRFRETHREQSVEIRGNIQEPWLSEIRRLDDSWNNTEASRLAESHAPVYFIKTRKGTLGVLQILSWGEDPGGVRLRYKLLQSVALATDESGHPSAPAAVSGTPSCAECHAGTAKLTQGAFSNLARPGVAWGPRSANLEMGVWIPQLSSEYQVGQVVTPHFVFRNAGSTRTVFHLPHFLDSRHFEKMTAVDGRGRPYRIVHSQPQSTAATDTFVGVLGSGDMMTVAGSPIKLGEGDAVTTETAISVRSGDVVRLVFELSDPATLARTLARSGEVKFTMAGAPAGDNTAAKLEFGPTIERKLNDISVGAKCALVLDSGELLTPPDEVRDFGDAVLQWPYAAVVDIIACGDGGGRGVRIVGPGVLAVKPADAHWNASPQTVAAAIRSMEEGIEEYKKTIPGFEDPRYANFSNMWAATPQTAPSLDEERQTLETQWQKLVELGRRQQADEILDTLGPLATYYFKSRNGTLGVLQILALKEEPRGLWLRYKCVRGEAAKTGVAPSPSVALANDTSLEIELDDRQPASTEAERAIVRLLQVFFDDRARRAIPAVMIQGTTDTLVVTAGPANIVPDGLPPAIDRAYLEIAEAPPVAAIYSPLSTEELFVYRARAGLTSYKPDVNVLLAVGDELSAVRNGLRVFYVSPYVARVTAVDQSTEIKIGKKTFSYRNLLEIDRSLPEGTPMFKDGKLAGLVLVGSHFLGDESGKSYLVGVDRISKLCEQIEATESAAVTTELAAKTVAGEPGFAQRLPRISGLAGRFGAVALSPDASVFVAAGEHQTAAIYNYHDARVLASLPLLTDVEPAAMAAHAPGQVWAEAELTSAAFSGDGRAVVLGTNLGQVKIFDAATGELRRTFRDDEQARAEANVIKGLPRAHARVAQVAFSPDGTRLVTAGEPFRGRGFDVISKTPITGQVKIWDVTTGDKLLDLADGHSGEVNDAAISPDGLYVVSVGYFPLGSERRGGRLWDIASGQLVRTFALPEVSWKKSIPMSVAFSPDGRRIAIGVHAFNDARESTGGAVHFYDVASGAWQGKWQAPRTVRQLQFSPDGDNALVLQEDRVLAYVGVMNGITRFDVGASSQDGKGRWESFALSPRGDRLVIGGQGGAMERGFIDRWNLFDEAPLK
jgi:WD40 repeat protein